MAGFAVADLLQAVVDFVGKAVLCEVAVCEVTDGVVVEVQDCPFCGCEALEESVVGGRCSVGGWEQRKLAIA